MAETLSDLSRAIIAARTIDDTQVLALRQQLWASFKLDQDDLDQLFAINDALGTPDVGFTDLFVEAVLHYLLRQSELHGFVTDAGAAWLIAHLMADGRVESCAELEMIVHLLEQAENDPEQLKQFALDQIEKSILTGSGPTRSGGDICPGVVDAVEAALLRRLIFASGGESATQVSEHEAELLFRIKDATLGAANAPEWTTLFVQAVGNHLMAHSDYQQLSLADARRLNLAMDSRASSLGSFLGRIAQSVSLESVKHPGTLMSQTKSHWGDDSAIAADRAISADESAWLKRMIAADAVTDDLEKALLAFIADESGGLDPELAAMRQAG
ncbi:MAG: hypothetical protein RL367_1374 [Pseudomonadota bacterium]